MAFFKTWATMVSIRLAEGLVCTSRALQHACTLAAQPGSRLGSGGSRLMHAFVLHRRRRRLCSSTLARRCSWRLPHGTRD